MSSLFLLGGGEHERLASPPGGHHVTMAVAPLFVQKLGTDLSTHAGRAADLFVGQGVSLQPFAESPALGAAGRLAVARGQRSGGIWRGRIDDVTGADQAASRVADLLEGAVQLDCRQVLAQRVLEPGTLRFIARPSDEEEERVEDLKVASALGKPASTKVRLVGDCGQILSHEATLWLLSTSADDRRFDALLRLQARPHHQDGSMPNQSNGGTAGAQVRVARLWPLGLAFELWREVPMVELPSLLRIMMGRAAHPDGFLVDDDEDNIVVHCWQRVPESEVEDSFKRRGPPGGIDALDLEGLLWLDVVAALEETPPCSEAPVPAHRVRLVDEGLATVDEVLGKDDVSQKGGASKVDAARLASLNFLRQFVEETPLREEVIPRLFPSGTGTVRVFSAELAEASDRPPTARPQSAPKPMSLDDLFSEDIDFRTPTPWSGADDQETEDPLRMHELTSVLLLNERSGFAFNFHCLQAIDPCS